MQIKVHSAQHLAIIQRSTWVDIRSRCCCCCGTTSCMPPQKIQYKRAIFVSILWMYIFIIFMIICVLGIQFLWWKLKSIRAVDFGTRSVANVIISIIWWLCVCDVRAYVCWSIESSAEKTATSTQITPLSNVIFTTFRIPSKNHSKNKNYASNRKPFI